MKKFIAIFSIFLILSFSINTITAVAQLDSSTFSEGFYSIDDLKLLPNVSYKAQNVSPNKVFLIVFDSDQKIQQSIRFEPNSPKYNIKPLQFGNRVVIVGQGKLSFSTT